MLGQRRLVATPTVPSAAVPRSSSPRSRALHGPPHALQCCDSFPAVAPDLSPQVEVGGAALRVSWESGLGATGEGANRTSQSCFQCPLCILNLHYCQVLGLHGPNTGFFLMDLPTF